MVARTVQPAPSGWFQCMRALLHDMTSLFFASLVVGAGHFDRAITITTLGIIPLALYRLFESDWDRTTIYLKYTRAMRLGAAGRAAIQRRIARHQANLAFSTGQTLFVAVLVEPYTVFFCPSRTVHCIVGS